MKAGYLKRPDCSVYYEVYGSGPAVVFAHGLGGNQLSWRQRVAHFSARYTCVTFACEQPALTAQFAPKGRHVSVAKTGHSVCFERAAEFNRIVEEFLQ